MTNPPVNAPVRIKYGKTTALKQLVEIQRILYEGIVNPDTSPIARAKLATSWERLEDRKRILRGRPLPGSLRPKTKPNVRTFSPYVPEEAP